MRETTPPKSFRQVLHSGVLASLKDTPHHLPACDEHSGWNQRAVRHRWMSIPSQRAVRHRCAIISSQWAVRHHCLPSSENGRFATVLLTGRHATSAFALQQRAVRHLCLVTTGGSPPLSNQLLATGGTPPSPRERAVRHRFSYWAVRHQYSPLQ